MTIHSVDINPTFAAKLVFGDALRRMRGRHRRLPGRRSCRCRGQATMIHLAPAAFRVRAVHERDPNRGGARRRHDGRADRRAPRQCRNAGAPARRQRHGGARRPRTGQGGPARPLLHRRRAAPGFDRQLRRGPRHACRRSTGSSKRWSSAWRSSRRWSPRSRRSWQTHAIVSSNTSGIPLNAIAAGRSQPFRQRWLGTHFFNPPRYLHLLEIIPTSDTLASVVDSVARCADRRLGKGVVVARDTPEFHRQPSGLVRRDPDLRGPRRPATPSKRSTP